MLLSEALFQPHRRESNLASDIYDENDFEKQTVCFRIIYYLFLDFDGHYQTFNAPDDEDEIW